MASVHDSSCTVCTEEFNATRTKIHCVGCDYYTCTECVERYLETSNNAAQCMNCHKPWTFEYLSERFGKASMKRILDNQKDRMFQEQRAMFPHTQAFVTNDIEMEENDREIKELHDALQARRSRRSMLIVQRRQLVRTSGTVPETETRVTYIRPCGKDECNGFVRDDNKKCGLCATEYCNQCMNEKGDDHECDQNDVLSIRMLRKDSKACPNCSVMIHRISGCPDMFCVDCHTAFNWNTLRINNNGNSNPHYYEWMRSRTPAAAERQNNDNNGCATLSSVQTKLTQCGHSRRISDAVCQAIMSVHHTANNVDQFKQSIRSQTVNGPSSTDFLTVTRDLRIQFMRNKTTEPIFKRNLQRIYKAMEFNNNVDQIQAVLTEHLQTIMNNVVDRSFNETTWLEEYVQFCVYINNCYWHLRKVFKYSRQTQPLVAIPRCVQAVCTNYDWLVTNVCV